MNASVLTIPLFMFGLGCSSTDFNSATDKASANKSEQDKSSTSDKASSDPASKSKGKSVENAGSEGEDGTSNSSSTATSTSTANAATSSSTSSSAEGGVGSTADSNPNPGATAQDPSGRGAAYSTTGDGDLPFEGEELSNPAGATKVVGAAPGASTDVTTAQQDSIKNCMKLWGWHHPFAPGRTRPDKIIFGNIEVGPANRILDGVLGTDFSGITDEEVTDKPSLILVISSINLASADFVLPTVTYKFHNPKGWYCIDFSLELASSLKVELKKGAQLADSRFDLSILSNSQSVAAAQVSVLSKVEVVTVP